MDVSNEMRQPIMPSVKMYRQPSYHFVDLIDYVLPAILFRSAKPVQTDSTHKFRIARLNYAHTHKLNGNCFIKLRNKVFPRSFTGRIFFVVVVGGFWWLNVYVSVSSTHKHTLKIRH